MITRQTVVKHLADYLNNRITLAALVDWAENAIMEGGMEDAYAEEIMNALGRIGVADVKNFGLLWEDCEKITEQLGFVLKVDVEKAA
jgi:hypothetical protein